MRGHFFKHFSRDAAQREGMCKRNFVVDIKSERVNFEHDTDWMFYIY